MTKIAYGAKSREELWGWFENRKEVVLTTRYLPKRHEEMADGSLYWIFEHTLVARSPIIKFAQRDDGRWHIHLEPRLIAVAPQPKRAHQGWRYLAEENAPRDLEDGESVDGVMPPSMVKELAKLGLA